MYKYSACGFFVLYSTTHPYVKIHNLFYSCVLAAQWCLFATLWASTVPPTCLTPTELWSLCPPLEPQPTKSLPSFPSCYSLSAWNASPQPQRCLSSLTLLVSNIHLRSFHWVRNQNEFLCFMTLWALYLFISSIIRMCSCKITHVIMFECVFPYLRIVLD